MIRFIVEQWRKLVAWENARQRKATDDLADALHRNWVARQELTAIRKVLARQIEERYERDYGKGQHE